MSEKGTGEKDKKILFSYVGLIFVVLIWGVSPIVTGVLYSYYSSAIYSAFVALICGVVIMIYSWQKLKMLNARYFKTAILFGVFLSIANICQKLGLKYTTPTNYAFLENLSCIAVPFLSFWFIKKKPTLIKLIASFICLLSAFFLSGIDLSTGKISFGIGDILCAIAGVLYGVNIAGTGAFAKDLDSGLYVMIQMFVQFVLSMTTAIAFSVIKINGAVIEEINISFNLLHLLFIAIVAIVTNAICWVVRAKALKVVDATFVAIIMPFSSIITSIISILMGKENVTWGFVIGVTLGVLAILISILSDIREIKGDNNDKLKNE